ncbi:glycoside hydrolase family 3 C-terminal domain-containing protein [Actinoplanes sp. NEAU-A12]|uniref:Glycoside hydrolase family 3 C-terminal domain-containing protein n=1 Tax=Actinoplanes sandaracinus TaxID=3045177 RepID=A0ABT6WEW5_9ACTN|nr:glycoside hydrolase family 3 C-terminal domain-containing protein [Actinoplanes sandaracinus]MDI6098252.1 glycoside hydrolase family 3 C-terminal domain-containing protein [Actinoplanes sandaracinus]
MTDLDDLVRQLSLEEKVSLLTGQDFWSLPAIPRIGLRSLVMSDGPVGVRGTGYAPDDPSVALPSPTALAATWDVALARRAGRLLGQESRRKGVHLLLGPTVNLHRTPLGGRHFECYSEDPLLTGEIAVGFVHGVQEHNVGTTVKHLVGNDFETDRMSVDVRIPERALRELYLAPFERAADAGGWGVMSAYNGVNGAPMAANGRIQDEILKREWGFDGVVVSDWRAARDTVASALGGLDIAMPAMDNPWGPALVEAVRSGLVPEDVIDDKVRRVLRLAARTGALDGYDLPAEPLDDDGDAVAHAVAVGSFVLARNDGALPLESGALSRVAVIGALATDARVLGGGSAQVTPRHVISPLDGLRAVLPGVDVAYATGADPRPFLPAAQGPDWAPFRFTIEENAFPVEAASIRWIGDPPGGLDVAGITSLELRTEITPSESGEHVLAISGFGAFELAVGGEKLYQGSLHPPGTGRADLLLHPREERFTVTLEAGVPVPVVLRQSFEPGTAHSVSTTLGHRPPGPDDDGLIAEAVALAAGSDVAVIVVGTTEQVESEGFDRTSLALPGRQDELVARVAAANPRTIVVVNAGSPVLLPWADEVAAVLLTWFPGQEAGAALADVLLGVAEPGGRLPTTWPRREEDCPVLEVRPADGALPYDEGIFIGYRGWSRQAADPLFAFGHGLGYTEWSYDHLACSGSEARVTVTNTGWRAGREVVQVYLSPGTDSLPSDGGSPAPDPGSPVERPERWLAGFATVDAEPGESVTVTIPIPQRAYQVWNDGWQTLPGTYTVIAAHALDDPRRSVEITV